jgi:uncharacterized membrane protein YfbV (UPF0208 family)
MVEIGLRVVLSAKVGIKTMPAIAIMLIAALENIAFFISPSVATCIYIPFSKQKTAMIWRLGCLADERHVSVKITKTRWLSVPPARMVWLYQIDFL